MVRDDKAETLEKAGLYRRALSRWLHVLDNCRNEDDREWIINHRNEIRGGIKPAKIEYDNFSEISKAASATQKRMGIAQINGDAFRLPPHRKKTRKGDK